MPLFLGGTIPSEDREQLKTLGVRAVFTADMQLSEVIKTLSREIAPEDVE